MMENCRGNESDLGNGNGKGARSAVGMGSRPGNIPCEIEATFDVRGWLFTILILRVWIRPMPGLVF